MLTAWVEEWRTAGCPLGLNIEQQPRVKKVIDRVLTQLAPEGVLKLFLGHEDEPNFGTTFSLSGGGYHVVRNPLAFKRQPDLTLMIEAEAYRLYRLLLESEVGDRLGQCSRCKRYYLNLGGLKRRQYCGRDCAQATAQRTFYKRHGDTIRAQMRQKMALQRRRQKKVTKKGAR